MMRDYKLFIYLSFFYVYVGGFLIPTDIHCVFESQLLSSFPFFFVSSIMDYTQRHQAAMDEVRPDYGINEDDAMEIPNFSLMERFLVIGGKDPNLFYKNIMKVIYPANRKKSSDVITTLNKKMELRKQINEGIEDSVGIFGLFKEIQTEKIDAIGNWFEK